MPFSLQPGRSEPGDRFPVRLSAMLLQSHFQGRGVGAVVRFGEF